jgi:hypothetical protein
MAGYSGTPLAKKLGLSPEGRASAVDAPTPSPLADLPFDTKSSGKADVIVWFVTERARFAAGLAAQTRRIHPAGGLWIAWPKRKSRVPTDLTEDVIREVALPLGVVDNKVCAIDETWSALRLVWRKENR